jgi:hypothetical protein
MTPGCSCSRLERRTRRRRFAAQAQSPATPLPSRCRARKHREPSPARKCSSFASSSLPTRQPYNRASVDSIMRQQCSKPIKKRAGEGNRQEIQFGPADGNPRERFRLVVQPAGLRNPGLEGATCRRTLCPNGTVMESVEFSTSSNGRELTDAELDAWVASFPIEPIADGIRLRPLPPQWGPDGSVPE